MSSIFGNIKLKTKAMMTPINNASPGLENNEVMKSCCFLKKRTKSEFSGIFQPIELFSAKKCTKKRNKTREN